MLFRSRKELNEVRSLHADLSKTLEKLASATTKIEEVARNPPAQPPMSNPTPPGRPTYADTVVRMLPATHATSLARQDAQF